MMMSETLRLRIESRFSLDRGGIHGVEHWTRVRENGLLLAQQTDADVAVVELFAWLHDSCRQHDGGDPAHGHRAADFVMELQAEGVFELDASNVDLLVCACRYHSHGQTEADITVQTCWDADRLDLGRVGTQPDPFYLCTDTAKDRRMIRWSYARSVGRTAPFPEFRDGK